ncbi:MAG: hypothetical protein RJA76_1628 [Bacteroidota bacterium]|jgi:hypothetical protein
MSNGKKRIETDCLNCGAEVTGNYCAICGQANVETDMHFFSLFSHFVVDFFHYDSKFLSTIRTLFLKPGQLSNEYFLGRRVRFLHPVQLYIFVSAIYFFFVFNVFSPLNEKYENKETQSVSIQINNGEFASDQQLNNYFKKQKSLPENEKDPQWVQNLLFNLHKASKHFDSKEDFLTSLQEEFVHKIPKLLFFILPFIALWFKLLFIRKKTPFIKHGIFVLHIAVSLFIVSFLNQVFTILLNSINHKMPYLSAIGIIFILYWLVYFFISLKRFYRLKFLSTLWAYAITFVAMFFMFIIAFYVNLLITLQFLGEN